MGDRIRTSFSVDGPETLNRTPWRCSCGDSMNLPLGLMFFNFPFSIKFSGRRFIKMYSVSNFLIISLLFVVSYLLDIHVFMF